QSNQPPPIRRRIGRILRRVKSRPAPERRMAWSFRIFREKYLRGPYVCQVEPLSKPSLLRVPETPPGGNSLTCHTRAGSRLADDTPLAPVSGPSTEPATALAPQTPPHSARVPAQHAASAGAPPPPPRRLGAE